LVDEQLREVVTLAWQDAEFPSARLSTWSGLLRSCGYLTDSDEQLTGELTIFRGVGRPEQQPGMSWTRELEKARWFATRSELLFRVETGEGNPTIYVATVEASDVLAFFVGRNEQEVVVDPRTLRAVQVLETLQPL
jgi:hypothetical protein